MNKAIHIAVVCLIAPVLFSGCIEKKIADSAILTFDLIDRDRVVIGKARIAENLEGGVTLVVDATNITPGEHGIHFHIKADCSSDDFTSAGGHINPHGKPHGLEHPEGPDNADMPNAVADDEGAVSYAFVNPRVSMRGEGGLPPLLDEDGSALMIHMFPDDQITQPIGGAGPRIACAEIKETPK